MRRMGRLLSGGLAAGMLLAALSGCTVGVPKKSLRSILCSRSRRSP